MDNQLPADTPEAIELKAEHEAALHFHPIYSPDQNTACRICYRNGAKEYATKLHQVEQENAEQKRSNTILEAASSVLNDQVNEARALLEKVVAMDEIRDHDLYNEIITFLDGK